MKTLNFMISIEGKLSDSFVHSELIQIILVNSTAEFTKFSLKNFSEIIT